MSASKSIANWYLVDRQKLITAFFNLLDIHPIPSKKILTVKNHLQTFYQTLIDYVSFGHFAVFNEIFETQKKANSNKAFLESKFLKSLIHGVTYEWNINS